MSDVMLAVFTAALLHAEPFLTMRRYGCVRATLEAAKLFELPDDLQCQGFATDQPLTKLIYRSAARSCEVIHDHGCLNSKRADALTKLEAQIDTLVHAAQWVGPRADFE